MIYEVIYGVILGIRKNMIYVVIYEVIYGVILGIRKNMIYAVIYG